MCDVCSARASAREGLHDPSVALAILIHGDAAFAGQGVVAETLNLSYLDGLSHRRHAPPDRQQPDRLHHRPERGRSTRYSTDLAQGFDAPIFHVNGDDPEAAIAAVRLALAYRDVQQRRGHRPRRLPPARPQRGGRGRYTQPLMSERIDEHPTVRELFARALVERGRGHRGRGASALVADARSDCARRTSG